MEKRKKQIMLEDIVPPLALCKQIPHPHFWNSAMCWRTFNKGRKDEYTIVFPTGTLDPHDDDVPAPTLQEILADMEWGRITHKTNIFFCETRNTKGGFAGGYNPAEIALQVWFNKNGVKSQ